MVDAAAGVQVGTEIAWECADDAGSPRAFFVNRIDRENADFDAAVTKIREIFGNKCVPIQLPIGAQERFTGIVDLIAMKAFMGDKASEASIPEDLAQSAMQYREQMIEAIAEADDDVINKYLEGEELSEEEISRALRSAVVQGIASPIMVGSAARNVGVDCLLDEPSSGLSEAETDDFAVLVRSLAQDDGRSVLIVEHDVELVLGLCSVVHVLDFGSIIASGTPDVIRADKRVQDAYLGADEEAAEELEEAAT